MIDLDALVASFSTVNATGYAITQRARVQYGFVRGIASATSDSTTYAIASVQPASGRDLLRLPELRRSNETRVLYMTTPLRTGDAGEDREADLVLIEGEQWEVQHVETWVQSPDGSGTAYRCIVQRPTDGQ